MTGPESLKPSIILAVKQFFAPNSSIFRITLAEKQEEEKHRQLKSVMRFTQTQKDEIFYSAYNRKSKEGIFK